MYTLAFDPASTFASIDKSRVAARLNGPHWTKLVPALLPLLPHLARGVAVDEGDVALVSTSGWAHQFRYGVPTVAYVHSPARWLYAEDDYRMGLAPVKRLGLKASSGHLRRADQPAMKRMDRLVSNSRTTRDRVWAAYRLESVVISPPVAPIDATPSRPRETLPQRYLLIVARNRGYKRLGVAAEAARTLGISLIIIGSGTQSLHEPSSSVYGIGRVTDAELKWLYQNAEALLATGREDFGLTVLEANAEGTPVVAVPAGGYLETVRPGVNGVFVEDEEPASFARAVQESCELSADSCRCWADTFSLTHHMAHLQEVLDDV